MVAKTHVHSLIIIYDNYNNPLRSLFSRLNVWYFAYVIYNFSWSHIFVVPWLQTLLQIPCSYLCTTHWDHWSSWSSTSRRYNVAVLACHRLWWILWPPEICFFLSMANKGSQPFLASDFLHAWKERPIEIYENIQVKHHFHLLSFPLCFALCFSIRPKFTSFGVVGWISLVTWSAPLIIS